MAQSTDQIKLQYPLPAYNYRVTILPGSAPGGGTQGDFAAASNPPPAISCSEVSGLNMEVETTTYKDGFSFLTGSNIIPTQRKEVTLAIKKGITAHNTYFFDWISLIYPIVVAKPDASRRKRDILIDLCDEKGYPVVRWMAINAMPTKLEAPTFDASTNEVAFERIEFIAHRLGMEYLNTS